MAVLGMLCSTVIPDLVWQCGNKTYFRAKKKGVEQMLNFFALPFSLLLHDCDFSEVPRVTSDSCCRQLWVPGELTEGASSIGSPPAPVASLSCDLALAELPYKATGGLNEYSRNTLRPLNERSRKNAPCYYLFIKVLRVLANSMSCWHLIIETVCLSDPLW